MPARGPETNAITVVVDAYNVIGSVPDGWWRDRPGAVRRLAGRLVGYQRATKRHVQLVLDVPQKDLPEGDHNGVEIRHARQRGRNAADARIVELLGDELRGQSVEVITSDRALAADAAALGATVVGARTFLARLDQLGC